MAKKVLSEAEIMQQIEEQRIKLLMDSMVEKIKEQEQQAYQINQLAKLKILEIEEKAAQKAKAYEDEIERIKFSLMALYDKVPKAETKTQCKVALISGDVVVKKPVAKLDYNKQTLLEQAEAAVKEYETKRDELKAKLDENEKRAEGGKTLEEYELLKKERVELVGQFTDLSCVWGEYIKTKEVRDFDWEAFKETLEIVPGEAENYAILNKETGEVMNIAGLSVVVEPEKVIVQ